MLTSESRHFGSECDHLINLVFLTGWTAADEAHLARLPEVICKWLSAQRVTLHISHQDPRRVRKFSYPATDEGPGVETPAFLQSPAFEFERPLAKEFVMALKVYTESMAPTPSQSAALQRILSLVHAALENLFTGLVDRRHLGDRIASLSDREWQVCQALESAESEKVIADQFVFSRHTLHTYVRNIYRKMMVNSRLAVIEKLRQARGDYRSRSMDRILRAGETPLLARNRTSEEYQTV